MVPSTSFTSIPQEIINNLHYSRRLLLLNSHIIHSSPPTNQALTPTYQVLDPSSSHGKNGFDANIIMILAVLVCALICSLCINTFIRFVIKCSSMMSGEPNYYLSMINNHDEKKKSVSGLDKRALKTFPVVKFSKDVQIQGLGSECVICLSDFKVGEKVRILPKCNHGFHVKCIDEWLSSHSSCPICRQSLVETCQKIIGCDHDHHTTTSSSTSPSSSSSSLISSSSSRDVVVVSIEPLEREDLVRNYRSTEGSQS
ncbi:RING-H2 finger protein ATL78 [Beta vulgaris subsp. vulgaris]|uniref:RING-H2 finger protein ATL78 n=1 Tax=Beta vulgaris subsp. vulgaris TaxID=3555 RepID=UPI00053F801E|nr:RING-H2 finger protein ATL78 [Beta vulgaris subsp. vulgaris]